MTTYKEIKEAQDTILDNWNEAGEKVISACFHSKPFNDSFDAFLKNCTPCGGNWGGWLLTGIFDLYPEVYHTIPEDMGHNAFSLIICVLILLGVDI